MPHSERFALLGELFAAGLINQQTMVDALSQSNDGEMKADPLLLLREVFAGDEQGAQFEQLRDAVCLQRKYLAWQWYKDRSKYKHVVQPLGLRDLPKVESGVLDVLPAFAQSEQLLLADWLLVHQHQQPLPQTKKIIDAALSLHYAAMPSSVENQSFHLLCLKVHTQDWPQELRDEIQERYFGGENDQEVADNDNEDLDALAQSNCPFELARCAALGLSADQQQRMEIIWISRFGDQARSWDEWIFWIDAQCATIVDTKNTQNAQSARLGLWYYIRAQEEKCEQGILYRIAHEIVGAYPARADECAQRWAEVVPPEEWRILMGQEPVEEIADLEADEIVVGDVTGEDAGEVVDQEQETFIERATKTQENYQSVEAKSVSRPESAKETVTRRPDWLTHIRSFIDEHWALLIGAFMILCGTALLAYYTWDKHWLVRYTLLPGLLAALTVGLARLGIWLKNRDQSMIGTAAILCGLAVGLLPTHALVPALLAGDGEVGAKGFVVPVAIILYMSGIFYALRRWCGAVHEHFKGPLTLALSACAALVMCAPLADYVAVSAEGKLLFICAAAYAVVACTVWAVHRYTRAMADDVTVRGECFSWFVGGTLAATMVQALAWAHALIAVAPQARHYGVVVIIIAWLVLLAERRANNRRLTQEPTQGLTREPIQELGSESFLGFAGILAGLCMCMGDPYWRIAALACAAAVWYDQARARCAPLHWWLASMLAASAALALACLPELNHSLRAPIVLSVGILFLICAHIFHIQDSEENPSVLAEALRGTAIGILVTAVAASVILQWHYQTATWLSAASITVAMLACLWQGCALHKQRWVLLAACMAVVALPYYGCIDMMGHNFYGNHMIAGLSILSIVWALLGRLRGAQTMAQTRSLVGFVLGVLAVITLCVRVTFEGGRAGDYSAMHMSLDYGGSLIMTLVLIAVAWWSRSLIPGILATLVMIILFPELKAQFTDAFENLGWGSGLGSAVTALILIVSCCVLRSRQWLKNLGPGDPLYAGRFFPWCRYDHTLLTWPLFAAAVFLCLRVDSLTFYRKFYEHVFLHNEAVPLKTIIALGVSSLSWIAILYYRGPHACSVRVTHFLRILASCFLAWSLWATTLMMVGHYKDLHLGTALTLPIISIVLCAFLLRMGKMGNNMWSMRNAAIRLDQIAVRLAVPLALCGIVALDTSVQAMDLWILFATCAALAMRDAYRSVSPEKATWFFVLVWLWYGSWQDGLTLHGMKGMIGGAALSVVLLAVREIYMRKNICSSVRWVPCMSSAQRIEKTFAGPLVACTQIILLPLVLAMAYICMSGLSGETIPNAAWCAFLSLIIAAYSYLQRSWPWALLGVLALWASIEWDYAMQAVGSHQRMLDVVRPQSLALLGSLLACIPFLVHEIKNRFPQLQACSPIQLPSGRDTILLAPAIASTVFSMMYISISHFLEKDFGNVLDMVSVYCMLIPPLLVVVQGRCILPATIVSILALIVANAVCVNQYAGEYLRELGLQRLHVLSFAVAITALMLSLCARMIPCTLIMIRQANCFLAACLLLMITANYMAHPSIETVSGIRFLASALVAIIAGRALRHLALGHISKSILWKNIGHAAYHLSVSLAVACVILSIPIMRSSALVLLALTAPVLYFYARAEIDRSAGDTMYRYSTVCIATALIFLTVFRSAFMLLLFPEQAADITRHDHYHDNAPILMLLGLIVMRCTGLGADRMFAFIGGIALMVGTWFVLTAIPGLSPFTNPIAATWCAIIVAHFFTLVSDQRSPIRTGLLRLLNYDPQAWHALRRQWGMVLLGASHVMLLCALGSRDLPTWFGEMNFLVLASASLLLHHGMLRESRKYIAFAFFEIIIALHIGGLAGGGAFENMSWGHSAAAWGLIVLWVLLLGVQQSRAQQKCAWLQQSQALIRPLTIGTLTFCVAAHVLLLEYDSFESIALATVFACCAALTPLRTQRIVPALCLLLFPVYLSYCSCINIAVATEKSHALAITVVAVCLSVLAIIADRFYRRGSRITTQAQPILAGQQLLALLRCHGASLAIFFHITALGIALYMTLTQFVLSSSIGSQPLAVALIMVAAIQAWAWYHIANQRKSVACLFICQLALGMLTVIIRQELRYYIPDYKMEYDVWAALLLSVFISGGRQLWDRQDRHVHLPLLWSAAMLPAATLSWIVIHNLGTDLALIAIALHSVGFSFLARSENANGKRSFHALSIMGFVGFALLAVWSKFELQVIHAYTIPVGIGILALIQLFKDNIEDQVRANVTTATLGMILISSAWHALFDNSYPLIFHLSLCICSLGILIAGGLLRIRVYMYCGFVGVVVAIASLVVYTLGEVDKGLRMSLIGGLVLLCGAALIGGALYLKTHREKVLSYITAWRERLQKWG